ncbi:hypothetical protein CVT24_005351 [Panaeolus cyanescens]|uniref:Methyltransferase domain-containing protein n=1 Tax=Panaeolus cyanescens TaxID=181874 RepID=A0A409Y9N3_9AGAR|nr:hypothetical protein CVT24_005351 [Panaeolus cyanescens]
MMLAMPLGSPPPIKNSFSSSTASTIFTTTSGSASTDGTTTKRFQQRRKDFQFKYGQRHHSYDSEKAPYPLSYDRQVLELESLDNKLAYYLRGSVSFVNFDEHPQRVLDLGCGTGTWVIDAAKEWPDCEFVGFDLVDIQIPVKMLHASVADRIQWKHGNFLTTKLPFDDDEFDHVHIQSIAKGVPENKWGILFEEVNRILRPGGSVEVIEDDAIFPVLPRWFTTALRARPLRSQSVHYPDGTYRGYPTLSTMPIPSHDHALLESLFQSVFENRFINMKPSSVLPNYLTTYFRHVTLGPVFYFPMPPLPPLQPLPPQITKSDIMEPMSDTEPKSPTAPSIMSATSVGSPAPSISTPSGLVNRPMSLSFSSSYSAFTTSTSTNSISSVMGTRPRTTSAPFSYNGETSTATLDGQQVPAGLPPVDVTTLPLKRFTIDNSANESEETALPHSLFPVEQLNSLSERSLAMHLYRSYQSVLACQEAMWDVLKDKIRNRKHELIPFGWDDDEELEELQSRKKFEKLFERYRSDMQARISLWCSLDNIGWPLPAKEPLSKAELIEEQRLRENMIEARKHATIEEMQRPCRAIRAFICICLPRLFLIYTPKLIIIEGLQLCKKLNARPVMAASTSKHSTSVQGNAAQTLKNSKKAATQKMSSKKGKGKENESTAISGKSAAAAAAAAVPSKTKEKDVVVEKAVEAVIGDAGIQPWNWTSLTDPSASRIPPVFSKDGSYFFSLVGPSVKIYSTVTGVVISTLTAPPLTEGGAQSDSITACVINPSNAFQLITASLDGRILIWDYVNATLLQTVNLGQPIHHLCAHEQFKGSVFVAVAKPRKKGATAIDNNAVVQQINLKADSKATSPVMLTVGKTRLTTSLAISPNGAWLVASAAHKVYIAKTSSLSTGFVKYVSPERLTCLAFHPFEEYFATGDDKGVVRLWYCLNDNLAVTVKGVEKRTETRPLHWHAHAVSSIAFSANGAYLLSGGEEAVLVIWQLQTGKKEFLPRVGAPITTVSVTKSSSTGEEEYLLGLADATYTFISSATLKITRSYSRIKIDPAIADESPSTSKTVLSVPLAIQPLTSTLLLPSSHPSSLQNYSPSTSTLVSEIEISPSNRVSRREEKPVVPSRVERVAVSSSGLWMATIDFRESDAGFRPEVYLKLWSWNTKDNSWTLNTRVDRPHGTEKVTAMAFAPSKTDAEYLITTGEDARTKLWKAGNTHKNLGPDSYVWSSHATLQFRREIPRSATWSSDCSIFAISFQSHVVLYEPRTGSVVQTITTPQCPSVASCTFVDRNNRYLLLVGSTKTQLVLWDLIDGAVAWQYTAQNAVDRVVPQPGEDAFTVFYTPVTEDEDTTTAASVFTVACPKPVASYNVPFAFSNIVHNSLHGQKGANFVGVTTSWRAVAFGDGTSFQKENELTARELNLDHRPQKRSLFQDIFGTSAFQQDSSDIIPVSSIPSLYQTSENRANELLDKPTHLLPSLTTLFDPLLRQCLKNRPPDDALKIEADEMDEDVEMEDEPHGPVLSTSSTIRPPNPGELELFTALFRKSCKVGMYT